MKTYFTLLMSLGLLASVQGQTGFDGIHNPDSVNMTMMPNWGYEFYFSNTAASNNFNDGYFETHPDLSNAPNPNFVFQGYQVLQLANPNVNWMSNLHNSDSVVIAGQEDLNDSIIIEQNTDPSCATYDAMISQNNGVDHHITVTYDHFTNQSFQNNQMYCFVLAAFAYNPYYEDPNCTGSPETVWVGTSLPQGGTAYKFCTSFSGVSPGPEFSSIQENEDKLVRVFPNPASEHFSVVADEKILNINVFDYKGALCYAHQPNATSTQIDVSQLSKGFYILQCQLSGKIIQKKMIVNE